MVPRAELAGLLEVMKMTELPLRVLCDCAFVVDGYAALVEGRSIRGLDHQDLWAAVEAEVKKGGLQRVQVVKVKAHTTLQDVEAGKISVLYRLYNERVDEFAKKGAGEHVLPPGLVLDAKKRRKVAAIIQHMMVRILQEREPLVGARIREELKQQTPRVDPAGLPARPASPTALGWRSAEWGQARGDSLVERRRRRSLV